MRSSSVTVAVGALRTSARATLLTCVERLALQSPAVVARPPTRAAWTTRSTALTDRLDAARDHPGVKAAAARDDAPNEPRISDLASVVLPVRYRRH